MANFCSRTIASVLASNDVERAARGFFGAVIAAGSARDTASPLATGAASGGRWHGGSVDVWVCAAVLVRPS